MFFSSWQALGRIALVGVLAYAALIVLIRLFGKRTLSKMNAFDFVVTVALGSTLATILLSKDVVLAEGVLAFCVLILLQYSVAWLSVRSKTIRDLVKSEPTLLFYRGAFLEDAMRRQRVVPEEVRAAVRAHGTGALAVVEAVILETDGSFSVIDRTDQPLTALEPDISMTALPSR